MSWTRTSIQNIASVKGGKRVPKGYSFAPEPTNHRYIRARDIKNNRILDSEAVYVDDETFSQIQNYTVSEGDVVLTIVGANIGDVGYVAGDLEGANLTENAARIRAEKGRCNPRFLSYLLSMPRSKERFQLLTGGSAQGKLGLYKINSCEIPLPPLQTQVRIASVVITYDSLIENNRRRIQLLEQAARLLYKEWFVYLRFPGHEHVRIVDGVPEGWERVNVPDVIAINPKEPISKGTEVQYVPMSSLSETEMVVDLADLELRRKPTSVRFRNGDTLFARITPCLENGKTACVNFLDDDEIACGSTEFIVLRGSRVSPFYTYCLARSYDFRENAIKSMIGSSGRQRVQVSCFTDYAIGIPPAVLLQQFDELASEAFDQIKTLMRMNHRLTQARDLLLSRLMSGAIVV